MLDWDVVAFNEPRFKLLVFLHKATDYIVQPVGFVNGNHILIDSVVGDFDALIMIVLIVALLDCLYNIRSVVDFGQQPIIHHHIGVLIDRILEISVNIVLDE